MVLPASDGIPRVPPYSGSTQEGTKFRLQGCYLLWRAFPDRFVYSVPLSLRIECPTTPRGKPLGLGCSRFARRYLGNRFCFLLLRVLRCFSSPGMPSIRYGFTYGYCPITDSGFPHSEISGSTLTYSSPKHIGVCPVLHRLLVPRHPPCALSNLTKHTLYCLALSFSSKREPFVAFLTACYLVFKEQSAKITRDIPSKLNEAKKRCYCVMSSEAKQSPTLFFMSSYELTSSATPRTVLRFSQYP